MSLGPMFDYSDPEGATYQDAGVSTAGLATPGNASGNIGINYGANFNLSGTIMVWAVLILGTMFVFHHDRSLL